MQYCRECNKDYPLKYFSVPTTEYCYGCYMSTILKSGKHKGIVSGLELIEIWESQNGICNICDGELDYKLGPLMLLTASIDHIDQQIGNIKAI